MSIAEKLTTIAENEQKVYEKGKVDGKNAEWNELWDGLQAMGNRDNYNTFCAYSQFIVDRDTTPRWNFRPKYDIKPKLVNSMFRGFNASSTASVGNKNIRIDLTQWLEDLGIVFDTSNCTDAQSMFYNCQGIVRVPFLDFSKCTSANSLANFCGQSAVLKTIDGIKSSENTAWDSRSFITNNLLSHCIFSGVIAKSFSLSNTKLDHESLLSVINCLKDYSGSSTTYTLTLGTTLQAKLTAEEKAIAQGKGWTLA